MRRSPRAETHEDPARSELAVAAFGASGPVAMALAGFDVPLPVVALATAGALVAHRAWPPPRWAGSAGSLLLAGAAVGVAGAPFAGLWLVLGLAIGRWAITGAPPHPSLPHAPSGSALPAAAIWSIAALRAWNPTYRYDPAPRALTLAILLAAVAGIAAPHGRRRALAAGAVAWTLAVEFGAQEINVTRRVGPVLLAGLAMLTAAAALSPADRRWSLAKQLGPLAWALPAMAWCAANASVWMVGISLADGWGYSAWREAASTLPTEYTSIIAVTAVPAALLGLLAIGAHLAISGRAGWRAVAEATGVSLGSACALGLAWSVGLPGA